MTKRRHLNQRYHLRLKYLSHYANYIMKIVFQDPTFSLQLLRVLGETYYKGADVGECLSTAYRVKEGDFESWHEEWLKTAKRVHKFAVDSLVAGHKVS